MGTDHEEENSRIDRAEACEDAVGQPTCKKAIRLSTVPGHRESSDSECGDVFVARVEKGGPEDVVLHKP